jgi:hypothetical protein
VSTRKRLCENSSTIWTSWRWRGLVSLPWAGHGAGIGLLTLFPVEPEETGSLPVGHGGSIAALITASVPLVPFLLVEGGDGGHRLAGLAALPSCPLAPLLPPRRLRPPWAWIDHRWSALTEISRRLKSRSSPSCILKILGSRWMKRKVRYCTCSPTHQTASAPPGGSVALTGFCWGPSSPILICISIFWKSVRLWLFRSLSFKTSRGAPWGVGCP